MKLVALILFLSIAFASAQEAEDADICLWPPNHKYVSLENLVKGKLVPPEGVDVDEWYENCIEATVTCVSDQPEDAGADGNTIHDCKYNEEADTLCVRSERQGYSMPGRRYAVSVVVDWNRCSAEEIKPDMIEFTIWVPTNFDSMNASGMACLSADSITLNAREVDESLCKDTAAYVCPCDLKDLACLIAEARSRSEELFWEAQDMFMTKGLPHKVRRVEIQKHQKDVFHYDVTLDQALQYGGSEWAMFMKAQEVAMGIPSKELSFEAVPQDDKDETSVTYRISISASGGNSKANPVQDLQGNQQPMPLVLVLGVAAVVTVVALIIAVAIIMYVVHRRRSGRKLLGESFEINSEDE